MAFNTLTGPLPSELGEMTKLGTNFLSEKQVCAAIQILIAISGDRLPPIPEFINMRSSQVSGPIPSELGRLGSLGKKEMSEFGAWFLETVLTLYRYRNAYTRGELAKW